jgi:lipopolysaccharide biosynthesis glycosyltransferase
VSATPAAETELEVLEEAEALVRAPAGELSEEQYGFLVRAADTAFTSERYELAETLYDLLASRGRGGEGALLRQVHVRILRGEPEAALALLSELEPELRWSLNGDRLRALALLDLDRVEEAVAVLRAVIARAPGDVAFVRLFVKSLERAGDTARLAELDEVVTGLDDAERFEILVRARLAARDLPALERLFAEHPPEVTSAATDQLAPVVRELTSSGRRAEAEGLLATVGMRGAESPKLAAAALSLYLVEGDWDNVERWLAAARSSPREDETSVLDLRELQYLCYTLRLDEAEKVAARWQSVEEMPNEGAVVVGALYGALGRWDDVVELLRQCVEHLVPVDSEVFLEAAGLAARRTGRYGEVADLLRRSAGDGEAPEGVALLLDRLGVELRLLASLGRIEPEAVDGISIGDSFFAERASAFTRLLAGDAGAAPAAPAPSAAGDPAGTVVFCADRRYLVGTCVAVSSLLRHNAFARSRLRLMVVGSADAFDLASEAIGGIAAAWGTPIDVIAAADLSAQASGAGLRTGWGRFTAGHGLSEAAYYRIFAVEKLLAAGDSGRVLYLDSDTCLGEGVEEFFDLDLGGAPLAARFELDLPAIGQAARKLGLDRETYFNSGVLLFDLRHDDLPAALERSIAVSFEQPELLTFVDQCALNIAFHGLVEPLPDRLNYYVRPKDELNDPDPVVWHFLERWKPWDPQYPSEHCGVWDEELAAFAGLVSRDLLAELLALQFESAPVYVPGS